MNSLIISVSAVENDILISVDVTTFKAEYFLYVLR